MLIAILIGVNNLSSCENAMEISIHNVSNVFVQSIVFELI